MQGLIEPILKSCCEELGVDAVKLIIEDCLGVLDFYGVYMGGDVVETSSGNRIYVKNETSWAKGASLHCTKVRQSTKKGYDYEAQEAVETDNDGFRTHLRRRGGGRGVKAHSRPVV